MNGGLGGVLVDSRANLVGWYRTKVSSMQVKKFMRPEQEVAIAELEILALLLAFVIWKNELLSKHVLCCLDNDVARFSLIKGYSENEMVSLITRHIFLQCESSVIMPWYIRVPSVSNVADFPSRWMHHPFLLEEFHVSDDVACQTMLSTMLMVLTQSEMDGGGTGA